MKKLMTFFGVAGLTMASLAAVNDTLISFSTPGTDTYADGTTVLDGECYALVWSKDGNFEGINLDGSPVDVNDRVVLVAPVAKDGRCPDLIYQVDADVASALAGGQYGVYLLDTRRADGAGGTTVGLDDGKLALVRSAAVAETGIAATAGGEPVTVAATEAVGGASATVLTEVEAPTVAIKLVDAKIQLTVTGMNPLADYWVQKATELKDFEKLAEKVADVPADGKVELDKGSTSAFFQVKGAVPAVK